MTYQLQRNTEKHPDTPAAIADALEEWYDNGQKGLETLSDVDVKHWFEKGRARLNGFVEAIRSLE